MKRRPQVLHFPHIEGNPYQNLLMDRFTGVDAEVTKGYPCDLLLSLLANKPDIVHVHWISDYLVHRNRGITVAKSTLFLTFCAFLKIVGVNIVWTAHNIKNHEGINPSYEIFFKTQFCRLVDSIIVHCDAAKEPLKAELNVSKQKMVTVPHGHYLSVYPNTISQEDARSKLGIDEGKTVFTFFGQIRPYKQIPLLIGAFKRINPADSKLIIAGNPINEEIRERIEHLTDDSPKIETNLQYILETDVQVFLNASDVVVLPFSATLTSGSAVLAMSFGKPVITSYQGCLKELLNNQQELLLNNNMAVSLENTIKDATESDLNRIGQENQEKIARFTWKRTAHETEAIYCKQLI